MSEEIYLPFSHDEMFKRVMRNEDIFKSVLEVLLNKEILKVVYVNTEQELYAGIDSKSVRMDAFLAEDKTIYDVEMQVVDKDNFAKRLRAYQSILDAQTMRKGDSFDSLRESYIIFICLFDPFDKDLLSYTIEPKCIEDASVVIDSEMHWIAFNARNYDLANIKHLQALLKYVVTNEVSDDGLVKKINEAVKAENTKEWVKKMFTHDENLTEDVTYRLNKLFKILAEKGDLEEIKRVAEDREYQKELLKKYNI